jgi:hypothetical protein
MAGAQQAVEDYAQRVADSPDARAEMLEGYERFRTQTYNWDSGTGDVDPPFRDLLDAFLKKAPPATDVT